MKVKIGKQALEQLLNQATFRYYGDILERKYGHYLSRRFPRCEEFWRAFVVPLTKRIEVPGGKLGTDIYFREGVDARLKYIASAHYSMFVHLAYAHRHAARPRASSVEDAYTHLVSACDLAETVVENWHLVRLLCQGKPSKVLQQHSRQDFERLAGEWYDENYADLYEFYLSKGKSMPIRIPGGDNLLQEYFGDVPVRKSYATLSNQIRTFRNIVVHNVKVGTLVTEEGTEYIPKISKISEYRTWEAIENVKDDEAIIERDFEEKKAHIKGSIQGLEARLNDLWEIVIRDFLEEFYSPERNQLREMFAINLSDTPTGFTVTVVKDDALAELPFHSQSGTNQFLGIPDDAPAYTTGSGIYQIDKNNQTDPGNPFPTSAGSALFEQKKPKQRPK